ncbi:Acg family FMN-binding oxidoreductase [Roseomonas rosulenta]|uniref:Acg family FMN-binding oxidoreductase n=1 Tax=Roseomonas rosulenta TaxID=2748667 RepID=UPI0018DF902A|nr:nitroreductase family protein [Roseomonas rosulenta]
MALRRSVLGGLAGAAALGGGIAWWVGRRDGAAYDAAAAQTWRPPDPAEQPALRELVRCATLAPNSHNTQPWRFLAVPGGLRLLPDPARRTPVVDPDDHHVFATLGCAAETMLQAAPALGLHAGIDVGAAGEAMLRVTPGAQRRPPMAEAIARRRSTRAPLDPAPLAAEERAALVAAGGSDPSVGMLLLDAPAQRAGLAELILAGNSTQLRDAAFVAELASWIRFSAGAALARRDGLFAGASGNPVLPEPIGRAIFPHVFTLAAETDRMARQLAGSAGFAVFAAERDDPAHWLAAGRAAQRVCLAATVMGLRTSWVNQPVEVPALRQVLGGWLGLGGRRPNLVLRFGHGPVLPASLRRPVEDVLVEGQA